MFSLPFFLSALAAVFLNGAQAASSYKLADSYTSRNFDASWDFFDQADPTNGYVKYVNSKTAQSSLMAGKTTTGNIYLGSDKGANGRQSIRISSKKSYKYHLMIADIVHAPVGTGSGGSCGLWPALWELGGPDQWPAAGEIDIYEGVNAQAANQMTLHTNQGCTVQKDQQAFSGNMTTTDCNVSNGANGNAGCAVVSQGRNQNSSFGAGFNAAGGGVYATEVSAQGIKIWHFPRDAVPGDIAGNPDPSSWGLPAAAFAGGCDIDKHFKNLQIVINTAFCGDWAGKVWNAPQNAGASPSCAQMTGAATCEAYVAAHPEAFDDAYWDIKSINVYTQGSDATDGAPAAKRGEKAERQPDKLTAIAGRIATAIERRRPDQSINVFSQPTGAALDNCEKLTPGHCGHQAKTATSRAAKISARLPVIISAIVALAVQGAI